MVEKIDDYPWSSYSFYTSRRKTPEWLYTTEVLQQSGTHHARKRYKAFVEMGIDEDIEKFYGKGNIKPYLKDRKFNNTFQVIKA